jgi:hypothetical protein
MSRWKIDKSILVNPKEEEYFVIVKMRDQNSFHISWPEIYVDTSWIEKAKDPKVKTFTFILKVPRPETNPLGVIGSGEVFEVDNWVFKKLKELGYLVYIREILRRDRDYSVIKFEAFRLSEFIKLWKKKYGKS